MTRLLRPQLLGALGALLLLISPAAATAAPTATATCATAGTTSQVFLPRFADPAFYYLAPDGSFEKKTWSGGTLATGNESFFVRSAKDTRSMAVASRVVSPPMCITLDAPTIRLFARRTAGPALSRLDVTALATVGGHPVRVPLAPVVAGGDWVATLPTPILVNLTTLPDVMGALDGTAATRVQVELTPTPGSAWQVDDVYVDPYGRR